MRHALVLICLSAVAYAAWHFLSPIERRHAARFVTRHGLRLGAIVLVILLLLCSAAYFPSSPIL